LSEGDDGNIHGAYCFVTQYGNRIDCSPDGELNVHGHVIGSSRKASVIFYSFFGAKNGFAELSLADDNSLTWNIVTHPQGDGYYGPNRIIFKKTVSQAATHVDERLVVVNKAYLYNEPSALRRSTAYVIKGDYVKPVSVSPDLRFWKVKFVAKSGRSIEKWIDCQDIDFCAK
jgi:hypothetical protein